ncbi:nuclear transport factor 2 family protein [Metallibacterium sp.]|jgi:hypothetical protein|uniref:YybH family protein n=1 Tax=Metallibacterium sp. TaxID=2940281 RepID=UPI002638E113|nr:nuclear transport factor 2 family protein [Metallibacterium sp.]
MSLSSGGVGGAAPNSVNWMLTRCAGLRRLPQALGRDSSSTIADTQKETHVKVTDPKNLNEHYNALFRAGDLEGLVGLYETSAVLCPAPGHQLNGHEQIREQMKALLTLQGDLVATQLSCVQQDDLAMLHAK